MTLLLFSQPALPAISSLDQELGLVYCRFIVKKRLIVGFLHMSTYFTTLDLSGCSSFYLISDGHHLHKLWGLLYSITWYLQFLSRLCI